MGVRRRGVRRREVRYFMRSTEGEAITGVKGGAGDGTADSQFVGLTACERAESAQAISGVKGGAGWWHSRRFAVVRTGVV